jgi:RNA polymerase sigma factor (sigma-70 family)
MAQSPKPPLIESPPDACAPGDHDLRALVVQYGPALRSYFLRRANAADVDDLVQDVFLKLQVRGATSHVESVEGYLFRTAANVLGHRRRRNSWIWGRQEDLDKTNGLTDELSPERVLLGKEALEGMLATLGELPPRCAMAFMLFRVEQLPQEVIARRMGISLRAVEALVQRATKRIHERMSGRQ